MALDLRKTLIQIQNIEGQNIKNDFEERLLQTFNLLNDSFEKNDDSIKKVFLAQENGKSSFTFAIPNLKKDENLKSIIEPEKGFKTPHIVISTDGSQINPSAHEVSSTSLINIGLIGIPYFNKEVPVTLSSEPTIINSTDELNPLNVEGRFTDDDLIAYERTLRETEDLVLLAEKYKNHNTPIVAILDGTLIHWHIEKFPNEHIEYFLNRFYTAIYKLKELNIPVCSFISNSRSNDIINMLKIIKCPFDEVNCKKFCENVSSKDLACNPTKEYKPVLDRKLVERFFGLDNEAGCRTILFKSNSKVLNYYPEDLKINFFYINTGSEIARVEIPQYVADNKDLLHLIQNAINLQCKVGYGYPIAISEAHLQAVVTKRDREVFYNLIKEHLLKNSKDSIKLSTKELRKRISFA